MNSLGTFFWDCFSLCCTRSCLKWLNLATGQLHNYSQQKCPTIDSQGIHPKSACACDNCSLNLHKHICVYDTLYHAHLRPLCALHCSMHLSTNVIIHMFVSRCWYKGAPLPHTGIDRLYVKLNLNPGLLSLDWRFMLIDCCDCSR